MTDHTTRARDIPDDGADEHAGDEATVADTLGPDGDSDGNGAGNGAAVAAGEAAAPGDADRAGAGDGDGDGGRAGLASPHRSRVRVVPLLAALVFFFAPIAAFVLGDRAEPIDNRALATMPSPSDGWSFLPDFTTWANDHLPLRAQAVERGTELSEAVFDEPPAYAQGGETAADGVQYPRVIHGEDGWLYFGSDVSGSCNPVRSVDEIVGSLQRLAAAVEASGRTAVIVVAPDKSTMVPEHLPDRYAGERCAAARKEATWDALTSAGLPLVDLRGPLADAQDRLDADLYRPTDSHWDERGASVFVEQVLNRLAPGLLAAEPDAFVEGDEVDAPGDLGGMIGTRTIDRIVDVSVERPGVTLADGRPIDSGTVPRLGAGAATVDVSSTGAPLIPGRTALLGDSFSAAVRPLLVPFFDQVTLLHNQAGPQALAQTIVGSDTVVVELVERSVAHGDLKLTNPDVVDQIEQALAANPRP